jgi:hypothetical membrane protein
MKLAVSRIHMVLGGITMLLIVLQFFLAGVGIFGAGDIDMHRSVGYLIAVLAAILLLLALAGTLGQKRILFSALLLVLMIVQIALIESDEPWVMAFHPLNGLLILGAGSEMMRHGRRAMRGDRAAEPSTMRAAQGE